MLMAIDRDGDGEDLSSEEVLSTPAHWRPNSMSHNSVTRKNEF